MSDRHPNSTEENGPSRLDRRAFLTASAGFVAAPWLAGVAAHAQTGATAARADAADSTGSVAAIGSWTMRALQMTAFRRPLEVTEIPVAAPRTDGAVVRVEASGVCRSDWHFCRANA